jgi:hypothetical protein
MDRVVFRPFQELKTQVSARLNQEQTHVYHLLAITILIVTISDLHEHRKIIILGCSVAFGFLILAASNVVCSTGKWFKFYDLIEYHKLPKELTDYRWGEVISILHVYFAVLFCIVFTILSIIFKLHP